MAKELKPEPMQPKAVSAPLPAPTPAGQRSAQALLDYLIQSGTPEDRLEESKSWLAEQPLDAEKRPTATAADLYRHMEAHDMPDGVTPGTLRKAGKWIWGDTFEPQEPGTQSVPIEDLHKVRAECENLRRQVVEANQQKNVMVRQRDHAIERLNDMARKVQILQGGRSHQELIDMGVEDPVLAKV